MMADIASVEDKPVSRLPARRPSRPPARAIRVPRVVLAHWPA